MSAGSETGAPGAVSSCTLVDLDAVAERVADEESFPRSRTTVFRRHTGGGQAGARAVHVRTFETEVPIRIRTTARLLYRDMNIQSAGSEPHAATNGADTAFDWNQCVLLGIEC